MSTLPQENTKLFSSVDPSNIMNDHSTDSFRGALDSIPTSQGLSLHNDLYSYVSVNQSQDSLAMSLEDCNYYNHLQQPNAISEEASSQGAFTSYFDADVSNFVRPDQSNEYSVSNVFNPYGNPNTYTTTRPVIEDLSDHPFTRRSKSQNSVLGTDYMDYKPSSISNFPEKSTHNEMGEDVLMIPQDVYEVYNPQELLDLNAYAINNSKDWSSPDDLTFVKADNIMYEFSDDEEEDDDWDTNKLEDSMDLDEIASYGSLKDEDHIAEDYIRGQDLYSPMMNFNYSSPPSDVDAIPDAINPADLEKQPTYLQGKTITVINGDDEEDLYTPAFESGINENIYKYQELLPPAPVILPSQITENSDVEEQNITDVVSIPEPSEDDKVLHERSNSSNSENSGFQPKRARKSNRKAKSSKETKEEDHFCLITNPKTGKPCNKRFSRPYDLVRHQNTIHASKRSFYRCLFCEDDLRRRNNLEPINDIVKDACYRSCHFSQENSQTQITSSTVIKTIKSGPDAGQEYISNKTFSRCDALTRHLRFRHGLGNKHVVLALDFAKNNVEFYES